MEPSLIFVLAGASQLPAGSTDLDTLRRIQREGVSGGTALKLYRLPADQPVDLGALPADGVLPTERTHGEGSCACICDSVIADLDGQTLWLGVYATAGDAAADGNASVRELDRFALVEAENETCWFYPTEDGSYLSWTCRRSLELLPGHLVEGVATRPADYQRNEVHVLWSLMADDPALTCVGLTYRRRRIEWPIQASRSLPGASWEHFRVDAMAEPSFQRLASRTTAASLP